MQQRHKILELFEHPSWPVIALKVVDTMIQSFSAKEQDRIITEESSIKHFEAIGSFLLDTAIAPLLGKEAKVVTETATGLAAGKVFGEFKNLFSTPQNIAFLETALPFIQPTIKELELYMRVTDMFRKLGVTFTDDAKFWECYIRERLYRQVDPRIDKTGKLRSTPTYGDTRETIVNRLMALSDKELCNELSTYVDMVPSPVVTLIMPTDINSQVDYVDPESTKTKEEIPLNAPTEKLPEKGTVAAVKEMLGLANPEPPAGAMTSVDTPDPIAKQLEPLEPISLDDNYTPNPNAKEIPILTKPEIPVSPVTTGYWKSPESYVRSWFA